MQQAIEGSFIIDVLPTSTEYDSAYGLGLRVKDECADAVKTEATHTTIQRWDAAASRNGLATPPRPVGLGRAPRAAPPCLAGHTG